MRTQQYLNKIKTRALNHYFHEAIMSCLNIVSRSSLYHQAQSLELLMSHESGKLCLLKLYQI